MPNECFPKYLRCKRKVYTIVMMVYYTFIHFWYKKLRENKKLTVKALKKNKKNNAI